MYEGCTEICFVNCVNLANFCLSCSKKISDEINLNSMIETACNDEQIGNGCVSFDMRKNVLSFEIGFFGEHHEKESTGKMIIHLRFSKDRNKCWANIAQAKYKYNTVNVNPPRNIRTIALPRLPMWPILPVCHSPVCHSRLRDLSMPCLSPCISIFMPCLLSSSSQSSLPRPCADTVPCVHRYFQ